jgi:hypothetical protein
VEEVLVRGQEFLVNFSPLLEGWLGVIRDMVKIPSLLILKKLGEKEWRAKSF